MTCAGCPDTACPLADDHRIWLDAGGKYMDSGEAVRYVTLYVEGDVRRNCPTWERHLIEPDTTETD